MADKDKTEKYAYLDQLSTEALEELLCADIESPEDNDDEVVFHILEVIRRREQNDSIEDTFDVDKAWAEFKQYYNTPEGEGLTLYPVDDEENNLDGREEPHAPKKSQRMKVTHLSHVLKMAGIVAAVIVCMFSLMLGVQAAGIDIFGAIGRWTNETFRFITTPGNMQDTEGGDIPSVSEGNGYYLSLQSTLSECGIIENLVPEWYPGEFKMSEPEVLSSDFGDKVLCNFDGPENKFFSIQVQRFNSLSDISSHTFEKDETTIGEYTSNEKTFYIMSNMDTITATWSDGSSLVVRIAGNISEDDIKTMIDSIGG